MKVPRLGLLLFPLFFGLLAHAQSNVNEEQGLKPYDSWHGGDLDRISLTDGGLVLTIPLASFPQRGNLDLGFFIRFSSKQWYVRCNLRGTSCAWAPAPNSGTQIVSSVDWWKQYNSAPNDPGIDWTLGVTSPDGNTHQFGVVQSGAGPVYPLRSLDATGLLMLDANTLVLPNGTRYSFVNGIGGSWVTGGKQPTSITDSNGNQITISTSGWTDTMGRLIPGSVSSHVVPGISTSDLSTCPSGTVSASIWNVPGVAGVNNGVRTFKFCYASFSVFTNFGGTDYNGTMSLLTAVVLPDLTMWTFNYDHYADITRVGFPTGGSISYTYATGPINCGSGTTMSMVVSSRTVDANDGAGGHTWTYSYSLPTNALYPLTTTVTAPDGNQQLHTSSNINGGLTCGLYETQSQYYQGSASGGTLLKTVSTQYSGNASLYDGSNGGQIDINVVPTQATVTLPGGQTSRVVSTYDASTPNSYGDPVIIGSPLQKDEYDFSNALVRRTVNHYLWQDNANYLNNNFISLPVSMTIKDGSSNQVAQSTFAYDQVGVATSGVTQSLVSPPAGGNIRGNQTTASHWLNTNNSFVSAFAVYYDTGSRASTTDSLNHTTTYSYSSAYAGAYVTGTCNTLNQCVSGTYDFNSGLLTNFTDLNSKSFSYTYDIRLRLSQSNHPDGGWTKFFYPNPTTVERQRLIAGTTHDDYFALFDGLGRTKQTQQVTPTGTVLVDTTYDAVGRTATVSNPYYQGSNHSTDPTYGLTSMQYDGLSRNIQITKQDGSVASTTYNNNCVTATDEAGHQRKGCIDALGRLIEVDEPNPSAPATNAQGNVAVTGSEQSSGSATPGSGAVTISGSEQFYVNDPCADWGGSCPYNVYDTGTVSVTVNGHTNSVSYGASDTPNTIVANLAAAVNGDSGASVTASASGATLTVTSKAVGSATNYSMSASSSTNDVADFGGPSFFATPSGSTLTGGHDAGYDAGTVSITVNGLQKTVSYSQGSTASSIANALASAFNNDSNSVVAASASGGTVNLVSKSAGANTNYSLSSSYTWNSGTYAQPSFRTTASGSSLSGGYDVAALPNNPYVTLYSYDTVGNLLCVEQHGAVSGTGCSASPSNDATSPWRIRRFTYDSLSHLLTSNNPETGQISYQYDADGEVTTKTDARGVAITYAYDQLHRLTGKTYSNSDSAASYFYDQAAFNGLSITNGIGHRTGMTDGSGSTAWSFDAMGRTLAERRTINGTTKSLAYSYNLDGSTATVTYPSGRTITYSVDSADRLLSAIDQANGINFAQNPVYAAAGELQSLVFGQSGSFAGITTSNAFNKRLQPATLSAASPTATLMSFTYDFHLGNGDNGNVFGITNGKNSVRSATFTYDPLNRLASAVASTSWADSYVYDAWGNLLQKNVPQGFPGEYFQSAVDVHNRLVGYGYDAAGNMTSDGTNAYSFDAEERVKTAAGVTYVYDGEGNRVSKSSGALYWGPGPLAESDAAGNILREYIYFGRTRIGRVDMPGGAVHYFLADHLGSASVVASASGAIESESDYYPFGVERVISNSVSNNYKFTGKERDTEDWLDFFGTRNYSSALGRFLTPDWSLRPTSIPHATLSDPQSLNLYSYVENHPMTGIDPDGHMAVLFNDKGSVVWAKGTGVDPGDGGMSLPDNRYDFTDQSGHTVTVTMDDPDDQELDWVPAGIIVQKVGSSANLKSDPNKKDKDTKEKKLEDKVANIIYNETAGLRPAPVGEDDGGGDEYALSDAQIGIGEVAVTLLSQGRLAPNCGSGGNIACDKLSKSAQTAIKNGVPDAVDAYNNAHAAAKIAISGSTNIAGGATHFYLLKSDPLWIPPWANGQIPTAMFGIFFNIGGGDAGARTAVVFIP